jgi:cell division protein FtsL
MKKNKLMSLIIIAVCVILTIFGFYSQIQSLNQDKSITDLTEELSDKI